MMRFYYAYNARYHILIAGFLFIEKVMIFFYKKDMSLRDICSANDSAISIWNNIKNLYIKT